MESRDNLRKLLEDFPLYKKIEIGQDLVDPDKLNGIGFNYHCETCNKETTQKLHFYRSGIPGFSKKIKSTLYPEELVDPSTNLFELTQLFETICNYCQNKSGIIVIQGNSNKNITDPYHKVFFQKIGQYPSFNSNANKRTLSVLTKKSQGLYRKAINLYGNSYGIGCMVYLRRIVEEEVLSILKQLLDPSAVQELEMIELENTGIEKRKVYEYASRLIPETLKVFGNNPILRLWDISSTAIHSKTDEEAMEMCHDMILLLDFLVDRLEFEKTETKNIKKILKD